jgi:mannose-6-phosphate isomerase class I
MKLQKFRWSKVYESQEEELVSLLSSKNIEFSSKDIAEFESLEVDISKNSTIWCAEGSFSLESGGQRISMQPGDALPVQGGTKLNISGGMSGGTFYESVSS